MTETMPCESLLLCQVEWSYISIVKFHYTAMSGLLHGQLSLNLPRTHTDYYCIGVLCQINCPTYQEGFFCVKIKGGGRHPKLYYRPNYEIYTVST